MAHIQKNRFPYWVISKILFLKLLTAFNTKEEEVMVFTPESGLVKVWVSLILAGTYTVDQVPVLFNLKEVVEQVLAGLS